MPTVDEVARLLNEVAPLELAESWDNVGLLVGDRDQPVQRVMTCLTLTPDSVLEATTRQANLVVTHHPLPFRPIERITSDTPEGRMLMALIASQVAVYSPHTAFDSAGQGINQHLANGLGLSGVEPLHPANDADVRDQLGGGRCGMLDHSLSLTDLAAKVKQFLSLEQIRVVGQGQPVADGIMRVAVACGSGGAFLDAARQHDCECLVTGETNFHTCLEAIATGVSLILTGHFASERFAVQWLAELLDSQLPEVEVWASTHETDPISLI